MSASLRALMALASLAGALCSGGALCASATAGYDIAVAIDPATRELRGTATVVIGAGRPVELMLAQRFEVDSISADGKPLGPARARDDLSVWPLGASQRARKVEVRWHGTLDPLDATLDHRQTLTAAAPVSGAEGTFLPAAAMWYPQLSGMLAPYRVALDLPAGQRGLVPGRLLDESESDGRYRARFEFVQPAEGIDLMAGPYRIDGRSVRTAAGSSVALRTYFHARIADLAQGYLDAVKDYLDLYESWIGPYPYTEFSIVSSPTPTGFGMPTLTYLGVDVLRLPFIRATSLGHEILHNWWGNGVYPDYARGNWSEGLTTFMADYAYKERESEAAARTLRLEWLRDFAAVPPGQDRPLAEFTSRTHGTSQIVGYHKAAMLFVMLRDLIGRDAFDRGVREFWRRYRFRTASWADLRKSFEAASGRDLGAFFAQWLDRTGAPSLRIAHAEADEGAGGYRVRVALAQERPAYRLRVPVAVRSAGGQALHNFDVERDAASFTFASAGKPVELALDPDLRLFRRLGPGEAPPILRQIMLDPATVTVLPGTPGPAVDAARALAEKLQDHPLNVHAGPERVSGVPLLVIGLSGEVDEWLASRFLGRKPDVLAGKGSAVVWTDTIRQGKTLAVVSARDADALTALLRPLPHYGRQSYLVFDGPKMIESGVWPSRPQVWRFK